MGSEVKGAMRKVERNGLDKKLNDRSELSINRHADDERKQNRLAWIKNSESLPDNCFADDVQDNDSSVYYSKSLMEGRRLHNE